MAAISGGSFARAVSGTQDFRKRCQACGVGESSTQPFVVLPVSVDEGRVFTIRSAIASLEVEEVLNDVNCSSCREHSCLVSCVVSDWPDILLVALKRFTVKDGVIRKNEELVSEPLETLHLDRVYRLKAVVIHLGSRFSGHYVALVYGEGKWYKCDDGHVTSITDSGARVLAAKGYIFCYNAQM